MLTDTEREATIARIAAQVRDFDDDTLCELDRLTDAARCAQPAAAATPGHGLTRRQLIAGAIAGGVTATVAGVGTALALHPEAAANTEVAALRSTIEVYEQLETVGLDRSVRSGLAKVGTAMTHAQDAAADLASGVGIVDGILAVPAPGVDDSFLAVLRQSLLEPARQAIRTQQALAETWRLDLDAPLTARLAERDALRSDLARTATEG